LRSTAPKKPRVPRKKGETAAATPTSAPQPAAGAAPAAPPVQLKPQAPAPAPTPLQPVAAKASEAGDDKPKQDNGGAQIVRLDAFRKK
jgi:hypothetical protein